MSKAKKYMLSKTHFIIEMGQVRLADLNDISNGVLVVWFVPKDSPNYTDVMNVIRSTSQSISSVSYGIYAVKSTDRAFFDNSAITIGRNGAIYCFVNGHIHLPYDASYGDPMNGGFGNFVSSCISSYSSQGMGYTQPLDSYTSSPMAMHSGYGLGGRGGKVNVSAVAKVRAPPPSSSHGGGEWRTSNNYAAPSNNLTFSYLDGLSGTDKDGKPLHSAYNEGYDTDLTPYNKPWER